MKCKDCQDEGKIVEICRGCSGSGEGYADGTSCSTCKGSGQDVTVCEYCDAYVHKLDYEDFDEPDDYCPGWESDRAADQWETDFWGEY